MPLGRRLTPTPRLAQTTSSIPHCLTDSHPHRTCPSASPCLLTSCTIASTRSPLLMTAHSTKLVR
eukprot:7018940-Prymnesium_polylepis.1